MTEPGGTKMALIVYRLSEVTPKRSAEFVQKVYGGQVSNRGYHYRRRGFLDDIPHWKVIRGVLMVPWRAHGKVVRELRNWTPEVYCWPLSLTTRQASHLRTPTEAASAPE